MTGLLWGLWHAPLWLMEGFAPVKLLAYVGAFMFAIICFNYILSCVFSITETCYTALSCISCSISSAGF